MSGESNERLVLELAGGGAPAELPPSGVLVVGSSAEKAGFLVEGQGVSAVHCAIGRASGGGWAIKDLGSDFGTFVNGKKVTAARLQEGDQILLGSRRLAVKRPGAPSALAPLPAAEPPAPKARPASKRAPAPDISASDPSLTRSQITPPPRIGGYRIERLLGRGGQGNVYLAVQESLARQVALKVLSAAVERDSEFVRRFQAEARAAAALAHPNVVTVHDVGEFEGHHYLSMEYMDNGSLEERVAAEGPLPWRIVLDALVDSAAGLVFAESRGIAHRDIKPANLMQNAGGVTKIADLGLASHADAEVEAETEAGRKIFGTPHFIAPEQVKGERADSRADLYSLGATAYRLLTGRTPFEGQNTREILRALLRDEPTPIAELVQGVPPELIAVVERLMRKDPEARHPSAGVLHNELVALQRRDQVLAAGGGALATGARKPLPLVLGLVGAVVVAGVLAFTFLGGGDEPTTPVRPGPVVGGNGTTQPVEPNDPGNDGTANLDGTLINEVAPPEVALDTDTQIKLLETEAELALLRLSQASLTGGEHITRLRELATQYKGTTAATKALEDAERIEAELARIAREEAARLSSVEVHLGALRTAANLGAQPFDVGNSLRAVQAIEPPAEFAGDAMLARSIAALEAEVVAAGIADTEAALARTDELLRRGEFDAGRAELDGARRRLDLPVFEPETAPEGLAKLLELRGKARRRLEEFDQLRLEALAKLGRDDAARIAGELRGAGGLEGDLARMDLAAANTRVAKLSQSVSTEDARVFVGSLAGDLERASTALRALHAGFGGWRRMLVPDPRDRRVGTREARGANEQGIVVDGADTIPWSAFAGRPRDLHAVFHERLDRAWTPEEQEGISALLRMQAVVETVGVVAGAFDVNQPALFSDRLARELLDPFGPSVDWAPTPASRKAAEAERRAAELLADALRQGTLGSWPRAVTGLERLIDLHGETLLVRMLSDGDALAPPPVVVDPPTTPVPPEGAPEAPTPPPTDGEVRTPDEGDESSGEAKDSGR